MTTEDVKVRIGANTMGLDAGLSKATKSVNKWAGGIASRFMKLSLAAAGALAPSIILGVGFEKNMKFVQAVVGATEDQFKKMNKTVRHLGATTEYTARQAAEGMKFLGMAGFNAEQSIAALPGVLDLATAGMMGLNEAADIATNILTQMGLEVEELGRVNDMLAKVQSTSNTTIQQAAEAFIYGGTMARQMGMEIEELAGFIGLLANRGIRGSLAGTTLRQSIIKLLNPSAKAGKMLDNLGISVRDASGQLRNFTDVILDMVDANIDAQQASMLLGARAGQLASLFSMGRADIEEYLEVIKRSEGTTDALAKAIRETLWGSFKSLTSALQEVGLAFYDSYKEPLQDAIDATVEYVREFGNFVRLNKELIELKVKTYFETVKNYMEGIVDYIGSHSQLLEFGAIGWFLFGRKGMLVGMAAGHIIGELDKIMRQIYPDYNREDTINRLKAEQMELRSLRDKSTGGVRKYRPPTGTGQPDVSPALANLLAVDTGGQFTGKDTFGFSGFSTQKREERFAKNAAHLRLLETQIATEKRLAAEKGVSDRMKAIRDDLTSYGIGLHKREGKSYEEKTRQEAEVANEVLEAEKKALDARGKAYQEYYDYKLSYEEFKKEEALRIVNKETEDKITAWKKQQEYLKSFTEFKVEEEKKAAEAVKELVEKQVQMYQNLANSMTNSMGEAFIEMIMGTKSVAESFKNMADSIIRDILRIVIQKQVSEPIAGALGPLLQTAGTTIGSMFMPTGHSGGVMGDGKFSTMPRLHGGLGPNEYPAVLEKGETVTPKGGGPTVVINMNNETGQAQEAQQQGQPRWDGSKFVIDVILQKLQTSQSFRQSVRSA